MHPDDSLASEDRHRKSQLDLICGNSLRHRQIYSCLLYTSLGRAPSIPEGHLGDPPNLVKLVDPSLELSSQHLEIRLDHWLVLAVDLGSTNGSDVIIPGREPVRLVAGVPEMLEPGAVVSLADVLTLTYEVW